MRAPLRLALSAALSGLAGCASSNGSYPSLQPRAGEAIDPRVAVVRPENDRPVTPALAARINALVSAAEASTSQFDQAAGEAERLGAAAGPAQSEGWIAAQEALTAAIAARQPVAQALGDIDGIAASALQAQGGIAPNEFAAINRAAARVAVLDQHQHERIDALKKRLGN